MELVTERLSVRLGEKDDSERIAAFFRDNDDFVARAQNRARPELKDASTLADVLEARLADHLADRSCCTFVFDRTSGEVVGTANLTQIVRGYFQACYLGYAVAERWQGRGMMTEALGALMGHAFEVMKLHRVMANHTPDNLRSARLLERLGFEREGLAKHYLEIDGVWRDHVLTALSAERFREIEPPLRDTGDARR